MKFIIYNYQLKKIAYNLWKSDLVNKSLFYKLLLNRHINKKINQYRGKPFCVRIENTNICNAKCVMCPRDKMTRSQGIMSTEIYNKIVDECAKSGVGYINLHNYGEPLIDPEITKRIRYAKEKGIKRVTTNTNASLLDAEKAEEIIKSGLDELYVSIDASKVETYKKVRVGLDYDTLVNNLLRFIEMKKKSGAKTKLIVSFVQSNENAKEVKEFIDFWRGKADHVSVSYAHDWVGSKKDTVVAKRFNSPCRLLFSDLTIAWNGDYLLCCADYDAEIRSGNVTKTSMEEFWKNNQQLSFYREMHRKNQTANLPLCKDCTLNTVWWF